MPTPALERERVVAPSRPKGTVVETVHKPVDPDSHLVARIAEGDQAAVRELVDRHINSLLAVARRMLATPEDAEEVVQEVFVKVWSHAHKWEPGRAVFATWMHRVTVNQCYDRLRKRREVTMDVLPEKADEGLNAEMLAGGKEIGVQIDAALQKLPDRQRAALVMCHYQGANQSEAAEALGVSVEALESLLARGRRTLRKLLAGLANDYEIGKNA